MDKGMDIFFRSNFFGIHNIQFNIFEDLANLLIQINDR